MADQVDPIEECERRIAQAELVNKKATAFWTTNDMIDVKLALPALLAAAREAKRLREALEHVIEIWWPAQLAHTTAAGMSEELGPRTKAMLELARAALEEKDG